MAPILSMLANTLFSIAADKMQSAAKDHIMKAIDENLDDDAKKVLDAAISDDKGHNKNSLSDLLG
jgi:DnaJ-domain-containing protein 1